MSKEYTAELEAVMGVDGITDAAKRARILNGRLVAIGLYDTCGRCGGSGHHSYNQVHGTVCYGCQGAGKVSRRHTKGLVEEAKGKVAAGELDAALAAIRERAAITREAKAAADVVMAAWTATGIEGLYDWNKAADKVEPHRSIADINRVMCAAHEAVFEASMRYEHDAKNSEERAAAAAALVALRDEALATIAEQAALLEPYR